MIISGDADFSLSRVARDSKFISILFHTLLLALVELVVVVWEALGPL